MPLELAGPWPPEADVPQVGYQDPPDHLEAYWMYGYDPAAQVGHYLYLAAEKGDLLLRRESIFLLLPDGSVLAQGGAGRNSHGAVAAGDRLRLECLEPFRRWRGRYAGQVHRLAGDEIVAGPRPGSELVERHRRRRGRVGRRALEHRGRLGRAAAVAALPPVLHGAAPSRPAAPGTRSPGPGSAATQGAGATCPASPATPSSTGASPAAAASACCATGRPPTAPSAAGASSTSTASCHDADVVAVAAPRPGRPARRAADDRAARGRHKAVITAETIASTFVTPAPEGRTYGAHPGDGPGTVLSPAFARYEWDGETGYGGLERSALRTAVTVPAAGSKATDERKR